MDFMGFEMSMVTGKGCQVTRITKGQGIIFLAKDGVEES